MSDQNKTIIVKHERPPSIVDWTCAGCCGFPALIVLLAVILGAISSAWTALFG